MVINIISGPLPRVGRQSVRMRTWQVGQSDRLDPIQLDDPGRQRLQLQRPRILLQLLQKDARSTVGSAVEIGSSTVISSSVPVSPGRSVAGSQAVSDAERQGAAAQLLQDPGVQQAVTADDAAAVGTRHAGQVGEDAARLLHDDLEGRDVP